MTILTYCSGLDLSTYRRFVGSLYDTGFSGNVVYFIHSSDEKNLKKLQNEYDDTRIQYVICDNVSSVTQKSWPRPSNPMYEDGLACLEKMNRMKSRFFFYRDYLNKAHIQSKYILLCDSSDVIFQKNLEEYPYEKYNADLYVAQEGVNTLSDSGMNRYWMWRTHEILKDKSITNFPKERPLADKFCICAGTTLGRKEAIKKYVNTFCETFEESWDEFNDTSISMKKCPERILGGLDQSVHNYLIYCNRLNLKIKIMSNKDDLVHTCGTMKEIDRGPDIGRCIACESDYAVHVNRFGEIANLDGKVAYIAHQYDRFHLNDRKRMPILMKYRMTKWSPMGAF